jgi:hypothetical protein
MNMSKKTAVINRDSPMYKLSSSLQQNRESGNLEMLIVKGVINMVSAINDSQTFHLKAGSFIK